MIEKIEILIAAILFLAVVLWLSLFSTLALAPLQEWFCKRFGFPRNVKTGKEGLIGKTATVRTFFDKDLESNFFRGQVFVNGSLWSAVLRMEDKITLKPGDKVKVVGVDSITLEIEPLA